MRDQEILAHWISIARRCNDLKRSLHLSRGRGAGIPQSASEPRSSTYRTSALVSRAKAVAIQRIIGSVILGHRIILKYDGSVLHRERHGVQGDRLRGKHSTLRIHSGSRVARSMVERMDR